MFSHLHSHILLLFFALTDCASFWYGSDSVDLAWPVSSHTGESLYSVWENKEFPCTDHPPQDSQQRTEFPIIGSNLVFNTTNSSTGDPRDYFSIDVFFGHISTATNKSAFAFWGRFILEDFRNVTQCYNPSINLPELLQGLPNLLPINTTLTGTNVTLGLTIARKSYYLSDYFSYNLEFVCAYLTIANTNDTEAAGCSTVTFYPAETPASTSSPTRDNKKWGIVTGIGIFLSLGVLLGYGLSYWRKRRSRKSKRPHKRNYLRSGLVTGATADNIELVNQEGGSQAQTDRAETGSTHSATHEQLPPYQKPPTYSEATRQQEAV